MEAGVLAGRGARWVGTAGLAMVVVLSGCGGTGDPAGQVTPSQVEDLGSPAPVADDPDPAVRSGAAGRFIECDGPVHLGGWAADFGPSAVAPDPGSALAAFLDQGLFGLPGSGYEQSAATQQRVLFTHEVDERAVVTVVVADLATLDPAEPDGLVSQVGDRGWLAETFATCDPAEYGADTDDELRQAVWTDQEGNRVATSVVTSYQGAEHCDWQSVTFLSLDDGTRQYLRDPEGRLTEELPVPYDGDTTLPQDAADTGYRRDGDELWLGADESVAYVVTDETVEAWPAPEVPVGCA